MKLIKWFIDTNGLHKNRKSPDQTKTFRRTIQNTGIFTDSYWREWKNKNGIFPTSSDADSTSKTSSQSYTRGAIFWGLCTFSIDAQGPMSGENTLESAILIGHCFSVPETCPYMANPVCGFLIRSENATLSGWLKDGRGIQILSHAAVPVCHPVDVT
jgi:hypothetical protein